MSNRPVVANDTEGTLRSLCDAARSTGRSDLVAAAQWLQQTRPAPTEEVVCHGDLPPFNVVVDGDR